MGHTPSNERRRVLLLAYACGPGRGSEPGVDLHRALQTAKRYDTWVIWEGYWQESISRWLEEHGPVPGLHFVFVPHTRMELALRRLPGCYYHVLRQWQRRAFNEARQLHEEHRFDLVHQLTLCTFRETGYGWKLDAPFVWGPLGGTQNYPASFLSHAGLLGAVSESLRRIANGLQLRFSPRVRAALRRADVLLVANSTTHEHIRLAHGRDARLMVETGIDAQSVPAQREANAESSHHAPRPLRILWSGVMEHRKALHVLLRALHEIPADVPYELRILGKGPLEARWRKLARNLGVDRHCHWLGWVAHDKVADQYAWADAFAFTSLRDTMGTVVLEALCHGLPVVCFDHQGAGDVVDGTCGVKVSPDDPEAAIAAFRDAIVALHSDRSWLAELSRGARWRGQQFTWDRQGERMARVYEELLSPYAESASETPGVPALPRSDLSAPVVEATP